MADRPPVPATGTVRRDSPAVGKELAGVIKSDHPVAQQHPALLLMAGHHPGRAMSRVLSAGTFRSVAARHPPVEHRLVAHRGSQQQSDRYVCVHCAFTIARRPHAGNRDDPPPRGVYGAGMVSPSLG